MKIPDREVGDFFYPFLVNHRGPSFNLFGKSL
jgi:hypothetical protein